MESPYDCTRWYGAAVLRVAAAVRDIAQLGDGDDHVVELLGRITRAIRDGDGRALCWRPIPGCGRCRRTTRRRSHAGPTPYVVPLSSRSSRTSPPSRNRPDLARPPPTSPPREPQRVHSTTRLRHDPDHRHERPGLVLGLAEARFGRELGGETAAGRSTGGYECRCAAN